MTTLPDKSRAWAAWCRYLTESQDPTPPPELIDHPEINAMCGVPQDPAHHPEGDAFTHTMRCMDAFMRTRTGRTLEDIIVGLAVLCHDMGKPSTTVVHLDGRITAHGHDKAGEGPTRSFLARITDDTLIVEHVVELVKYHMQPAFLRKLSKEGTLPARLDRSLIRLSGKVDLHWLARVCYCDYAGRPPRPIPDTPKWFWNTADDLGLKSARRPRPTWAA